MVKRDTETRVVMRNSRETWNAETLSDLSSISLSIPDKGRRDDATRVGHEEPRAVAWD